MIQGIKNGSLIHLLNFSQLKRSGEWKLGFGVRPAYGDRIGERVSIRPAYAERVPVHKNNLEMNKGHRSGTWKVRHFRQKNLVSTDVLITKKKNNDINKNRKFGKMSQEVPQSSEQTAARESPADPEPSGSEPSKR